MRTRAVITDAAAANTALLELRKELDELKVLLRLGRDLKAFSRLFEAMAKPLCAG